MSEPVSNSEIEDVLSSIRRLVSEDGRKVGGSDGDNDHDSSNDRLVLTPALRVAEAETGASQEAEAASDSEPETEDHAADVVDYAEARDTGGHQQETGEAAADAHASDVPDTWDDDQNAGASENSRDEGDDQAEAMPSSDAEGGLEAKIAELEALIGRSDEEWEPDHAGQDAYAGETTEALEWEDTVGPSDTDGDPSGGNTGWEEPETDEMHDQDPGVPAPAVEQGALDAGWSVQDADLSEDMDDDDPEDDLFADDAPLIDEAALRDMVSEIVREELQGELGERITRNVRKLVRREIQRALTTKQFD